MKALIFMIGLVIGIALGAISAIYHESHTPSIQCAKVVASFQMSSKDTIALHSVWWAVGYSSNKDTVFFDSFIHTFKVSDFTVNNIEDTSLQLRKVDSSIGIYAKDDTTCCRFHNIK